MGKNNRPKGLGFVGDKYRLLMKINEGAAWAEQPGNGGRALMSLPRTLPSWHMGGRRTHCPPLPLGFHQGLGTELQPER